MSMGFDALRRLALRCAIAALAMASFSAAGQPLDLLATEKASHQFLAQGNYAAAEVEAKKLLEGVKARFGVDHMAYAVALNNLGIVNERQGKYADAAASFQRALAIEEIKAGKDNLGVAEILNNLGAVNQDQGKYADAATYFQRAIGVLEVKLGKDHPSVAAALNNLAIADGNQGKYADAIAHNQRALAIREAALGKEHPDVALSLNNLAIAYQSQGKFAEAIALYQRALAIREKVLGKDHPDVAGTLNNLANIYQNLGKFAEATALFQRALAIDETALGKNHPGLANILNNLASIYQSQGRYAEAIALHQRALAIREAALGKDHPDVAASLGNLANVYNEQGNYAEAVSLYRRALAINEVRLGGGHPAVASDLNNLALVYQRQARYGDAVAMYQRALAIRQARLGENHPDVAASLANLAIASGLSGDARQALSYSRRATAAVIAHAADERPGDKPDSSPGGLVEQRAVYFRTHVANLATAAGKGIEAEPAAGHEAFESAQWAVQSAAASALQQTSLRVAAGDGALAALVRDNQDLAAAWREKDKLLLAALSRSGSQQDAAATEALRQQMGTIDARRAANAVQLQKQFPGYAALTDPQPAKVEDAQKLLAADEALAFFMVDAQQSYVFALTRDGFDWKTIPLGASDMSAKIAAFRRGLNVNRAAGNADLFDLRLANELYATLLGPIEPFLKDKKQLMVVPAGVLTALPFHLLVTERPTAAVPDTLDGYRDAAWLIKRQAVDVLPSVASLKALRGYGHGNTAAKPLVGFGDPVFNPDNVESGQRLPGKTASRNLVTAAYTDFWQGAGIDRAKLAQSLPQLPDTADELKAVARDLGAPASDIHLGRDASETVVKRTPLADYRIVYFATHGLVAGDVSGLAEPSLALSIPKSPTELDDGLLTASEVAQLKLNADWVVLSACNTIAGDKPGAEALSGLARAFFYAGARALLVSHWAVDSAAAARLATTTFDLLKKNPGIGRAEALRQAMLGYLNDRSVPGNAYPAIWGPFAIIGESGAR